MESPNHFESARYLVSFAASETDDIRSILKEFFAQDNLTTALTEFDPERGEHIAKLRFAKPIPIVLRGKVSNVIKNLRDALDQATFARSLIIRGKPSNRTHFPFGESPDDLENSLSRRKAVPCKGIPEELFPLLREFEPYPTGDGYEGGNNDLRMLGRVSGPHKHAITLQVANVMVMTGFGPGILRAGPGGVILLNPPIWHSANSELEMARIPIGGYLDIAANLTFGVTFGEGPLMDTEVRPFLERLGKTVGTIVERLANFG